jgi:hypothetical protein
LIMWVEFVVILKHKGALYGTLSDILMRYNRFLLHQFYFMSVNNEIIVL